jgi:hypothetical protein
LQGFRQREDKLKKNGMKKKDRENMKKNLRIKGKIYAKRTEKDKNENERWNTGVS